MSTLSNIVAGLAEGLRMARLYQELSHMSDRQLADIGLTRDNISRRALDLARRG